MKKILGVQLDKRILTEVSQNDTTSFVKTMLKKLEYIERIINGEIRAAGKSVKFLRREGNKTAIKYRFRKRRFSFVLGKNILTCVKLSNHDRQIKDIDRFQEKRAGLVYYTLNEFKKLLSEFNSEENLTLAKYLTLPEHYILSDAQEEILTNRFESLNLSVVGNAGAGKSLIGMKWIAEETQKEDNDALYLTMSENLAYSLYDEFEIELKKTSKSNLKIMAVGDFFAEYLEKAYPELADYSFLTSKESFDFFKNFWVKKIKGNMRDCSAYWREIHGFLRGALPFDLNLKDKVKLPKIISEDEYAKLHELYGEKRYLPYKAVLEVYEKYKNSLTLYKYFDDNDAAEMLIESDIVAPEYKAFFLDECQDLTQKQTLAILLVLTKAESRVFASDRCQMVQPVWFKEGSLRTLANKLDKAWGRNVNEDGLRARYLNCNFRSTKKVIAFQNALITFFRDNNSLSLKQSELMEIESPVLQREGVKPIWIRANKKNKKAVEKILKGISAADLQLITANKEADNEFAADVVECKGMEYPAVLAYNLMKDAGEDFQLALKYFYVGVTRSSNILLIYDELIEEDESLSALFKKAAKDKIIEECEDLYGEKTGFSGNFISYVKNLISSEITTEEKMAVARDAIDYGQYKLALRIYEEILPNDETVYYLRGKILESEKRYSEAIENYYKLSPKWKNQGKSRQNAVDLMLRAKSTAPQDFIEALLLRYEVLTEFFTVGKKKFEARYKNSIGFYDEVFGSEKVKKEILSGIT
ncbi:MAG: DUF2075 domain-containing protein [Selenomonadaceae bacterium]|nr:DUF2075 domain-containing protein [Selenomonadaceae bacterium]